MREILRNLLHACGVEVRLLRNLKQNQEGTWMDECREHWRFVQSYDIRTVLDIGANTGQFARMYEALFPGAKIYSFEPLPDCFAELDAYLDTLPGCKAFPFALGAEQGSTEFQSSAFSPSSSMLSMTEEHKRLWPDSASNQTRTIQIERLDTLAAELDLEPGLLIKMDVQGFEHEVIKGGAETIRQAAICVLEVNFVALYEGQAWFDQLYPALTELGLEFSGIIDQHRDPESGRPVFADILFTRNAKEPRH